MLKEAFHKLHINDEDGIIAFEGNNVKKRQIFFYV